MVVTSILSSSSFIVGRYRRFGASANRWMRRPETVPASLREAVRDPSAPRALLASVRDDRDSILRLILAANRLPLAVYGWTDVERGVARPARGDRLPAQAAGGRSARG